MSAMGQALGLVKIENPNYQVVNKIDSTTEIRKYQISKWVSTNMITNVKKIDSVSSPMFRKLFNYISGSNDKSASIQMTAPVTMVFKNSQNELMNLNSNCSVTMSFYVPKNNQDNTPLPTDSSVFVQTMNEFTVATIRFSGFATMNDNLKNRDALIQKLGSLASNYDTINIITAGYDSPFTLFNRRNEVWLLKKN